MTSDSVPVATASIALQAFGCADPFDTLDEALHLVRQPIEIFFCAGPAILLVRKLERKFFDECIFLDTFTLRALATLHLFIVGRLVPELSKGIPFLGRGFSHISDATVCLLQCLLELGIFLSKVEIVSPHLSKFVS